MGRADGPRAGDRAGRGPAGRGGRAYCNYYATLCAAKRFAEAEPLYADGTAYCDDHDIVTYGTFLRSERTGMLEKTGRWDEALALSLDILDRAAPAPATRLCPTTRSARSCPAAARTAPGNTSTRPWPTRIRPASRSRSSRSGWPGPRRAGWKAGPPICAGQTNTAIAAKLFISAKTVDHHVSAVLAKLGAPNRNAAAAQAAKLNLLG